MSCAADYGRKSSSAFPAWSLVAMRSLMPASVSPGMSRLTAKITTRSALGVFPSPGYARSLTRRQASRKERVMLECLPEASFATFARLAQEAGVTAEQLNTALLYWGRRTGGGLMGGGCAL